MSFFKDPLLHVLVAGIAVYVLYLLIDQDQTELDEIHVDRQALIAFIGNRTQSFEVTAAEAHLDSLSDSQIGDLIDQFVRESALHQEALRLGLDRDDYVMRRRLVQRLESMLVALAPNQHPADEQTLRTYFAENLGDYLLPARITFTHVFVDGLNEANDTSRDRADALLQRLIAQQIGFSQALEFGDAFLYHRNYVERPREDIASHFGEPMAAALFSISDNDLKIGKWFGPVLSDHGYHLVLVRERRDARHAIFSEVRRLVERDYQREQRQAALEAAARSIIEKYPVTIDLGT